jgi:hypothetical protein
MTSKFVGVRRATAPVAAVVAAVVAGGLLLAGCGAKETHDKRGYVKAPLDKPALVIKSEPETSMSKIGRPAYDPVVILTPDSVGAKPK